MVVGAGVDWVLISDLIDLEQLKDERTQSALYAVSDNMQRTRLIGYLNLINDKLFSSGLSSMDDARRYYLQAVLTYTCLDLVIDLPDQDGVKNYFKKMITQGYNVEDPFVLYFVNGGYSKDELVSSGLIPLENGAFGERSKNRANKSFLKVQDDELWRIASEFKYDSQSGKLAEYGPEMHLMFAIYLHVGFPMFDFSASVGRSRAYSSIDDILKQTHGQFCVEVPERFLR
jgi:hypothetical protein